MAELRGGTTIGGYAALHSGLREARLGGNLTVDKKIIMGTAVGTGVFATTSGSTPVLGSRSGSTTDVELNAMSGSIHLGGAETSTIWLKRDLVSNTGAKTIADTSGNLYFQGESTDTRYVRKGSDGYLTVDLVGSSAYPRMVVQNGGGSDNDWIRIGGTGSHGLLPYSNGTSSIGTSSWRFREIHAVNFYEDGTALSSKYAAANHNHNSTYLNKTGDTFSGDMVSTTRSSGIYGSYDSYKVDHIWSMGTGYKVNSSGTNFGNLYGMAYKHTNNTTGGTMAGGHQIVFTSSGTPGAAIGLAGGIWTSGDVNARHIMATNDVSGTTLYEGGLQLSSKYVSKLTSNTIAGDLTVDDLNADRVNTDYLDVNGNIYGEWMQITNPSAQYSTSFQDPTVRIMTINDGPNLGFYTTGNVLMGRAGFLKSPTSVMTFENNIGSQVDIKMNNNYMSLYTVESFYHRVVDFGGAGIMKILNGSIKSFQFRDGVDVNYIEIQASNFKVGSMRAYKKNIEPIKKGNRSKVRETPIFEYNLREQEDTEKKTMGLVFEEAPEELRGEDSIDLYSMITMLWGAVQELDEELETLKKKQKRN